MMLSKLVTILVVALVAGACTGDETEVVPSFDCDGLANRWITLQQGYLDKLDDADAAEFEGRSDRVTSAETWMGQAMIEQARDAEAVGCSATLAAGSLALCARLGQLEPGGAAAESVIESLRLACSDQRPSR